MGLTLELGLPDTESEPMNSLPDWSLGSAAAAAVAAVAVNIRRYRLDYIGRNLPQTIAAVRWAFAMYQSARI